MASRIGKTTLIAVFLSIAYSMSLAAYLPYRAKNDEKNVVGDIHQILQTGHIYDPTYASGSGYSAWISMILKITGLEYFATDWLSPLIGSIGLIMMGVFALYVIRIDHPISPLGSATVYITPFLFAFYISRIRETTHKLLTFTLIFMLVYTVFNFLIRREVQKYKCIFCTSIVTLSFLNLFWAAIYGSILIIAMVVAQKYKQQSSKYHLLSLAFLLGTMMAIWSPLADFRMEHIVRKYFFAIVASASTSDVPSLSQRASAWPQVGIAGTNVSLGVVLSIGIGVAAGLVGLAMLHIVYQHLMGETLQPLSLLTATVAVLSGGLLIGLLAVGGIPTAKRIILLPGVLGVLYWVDILTKSENPVFGHDIARYKNATLGVLFVIILLSSLIGVPRIMMDGKLNPNKFYAEDSDLARVEWVGAYGQNCTTHQHIDRIIAAKFKQNISVNENINEEMQVVYSGGKGLEDSITCPS